LGAILYDEQEITSSKIFVYTFASPNVSQDMRTFDEKYNFIWNIVNAEDAVPSVPPNRGNWQWKKFGQTRYIVNYWNCGSQKYISDYLPRMNEYYKKLLFREYAPFKTGPFLPIQASRVLTGVFNDIRELYSNTNDAKMKGYTAGRFSFNTKGGRCEACEGDGIIKIEMHFLPDVFVPCDVCKGHRYNRETLEVRYRGKNIYDVLEMTVDEGVEFFENHSKIYRKLLTLQEVGLGYIKIGQPATTLSGGEAQRVKLATELSKRSTGRTIYILDEPTTGLHSADVAKLLEVLQRLADQGDTVLVIEHNLDVIKCADYIIDLGPEGGDNGGTLVACGTPEEIAKNEASYTGQYLKKLLKKRK
jgi:excinuclease ABC subunit A